MGSYEQRFFFGGGGGEWGIRLIASEKLMTVHLLAFSKYSVKKSIPSNNDGKIKLAPPQDSVKVTCERNLYACFSRSSQIYTNLVAFHSH